MTVLSSSFSSRHLCHPVQRGSNRQVSDPGTCCCCGLIQKEWPQGVLWDWCDSIQGGKWSYGQRGGGLWCLHLGQVQLELDVHILERSIPSFYFQSLVFSCVKWVSDVMLTLLRKCFLFHRWKVFYRTDVFYFFLGNHNSTMKFHVFLLVASITCALLNRNSLCFPM